MSRYNTEVSEARFLLLTCRVSGVYDKLTALHLFHFNFQGDGAGEAIDWFLAFGFASSSLAVVISPFFYYCISAQKGNFYL